MSPADEREIARQVIDLQKRGRDFRMVDLPGYMEWSQKHLEDHPEDDVLIAHLDAMDMFLLPEQVAEVPVSHFEELLEDIRYELE